MTLFKGDHVVKLDLSGQPIMGPDASEVYVEYEVVEPPIPHQERGETGEFAHENYIVLLRKVR